MDIKDPINYDRIARAIAYIRENHRQQPTLAEIADEVHLSPFHFQRLFTDWAGVSPKKFLQYTNLQYAKSILRESRETLFETAYRTGLSGTGRLHDLFIKIEGMTPGEFKNGGSDLTINYDVPYTRFGKLLVASTSKGICHMAFIDDVKDGFEELRARFPNADFHPRSDGIQAGAVKLFHRDWSNIDQIKLHLKGTDFQLKVWETLLDIPFGHLVSYGDIAMKMGASDASRAVGNAVGLNPVAYLVPCHRVIRSTGHLGGYRWGETRKVALMGWEAAIEGR
ncbi:methylated-DNA--[protein]-cysteine S-methyltransferase [Muricauda sp. NFXS6]|uniref:bifunctional transcriptional activator/DNA repair enzyme AdaA n=1 Tax=Allomuricauda sp. NFXS6 TaxID=2819094 RepID=UPI0032DF176E